MTEPNILYFSTKEAAKIHDNMVIAISGGLSGTLDKERLESVFSHIKL